jgi:hypothetical protein
MTPEQQTPASVVERLRDEAHKIRSQKERGPAFHAPWGQDIIDANNAKADLFTKAAALIERLSAEREGLREALEKVRNTTHQSTGYSDLSARRAAFGVSEAALTQGESNADIAQDFAAAVRAKRKPERDPKLQRHDVDAHRVLTGQSATQGESRQTGPSGWLIKDYADGWEWTGQRIAAVAALTEGHAVWDIARQSYALPAAPTPAGGGGE